MSAPLLIQCSGFVLYFLVQVCVARVIGAHEFGVFSLATAWLMSLAILSRWGYDSVVMRYGGTYFQAGDYSSLDRLIRYANHRVLAVSILVSAATLLVSLVLFRLHERRDLALSLMLGLPIIPIFALAGLRQSALLVVARRVSALAPEYLLRPGVLLLGVVWIAIAGQSVGPQWVMAASVLACLAALLTGGFLQRLALGAYPREFITHSDPKWRQMASRMLVIGVAFQMISQSDILVAGWLLAPTDVALYAAAKQIASVGLLGLIALQWANSAQFAAAHSRRDFGKLLVDARLVMKIGAAFSLGYLVLVFVFGGFGLAIYGQTFADGKNILLLLCLAHLVNALLGPAGSVASMSGLEHKLVPIASLSLLLGVLFMIVLGSIGGGLGVAVGALLATVLWGVLVNRLLVSELGFAVAVWYPRSGDRL